MNLRRVVPIAAGTAIFVVALYGLRNALADYDFSEVRRDLSAVPTSDILRAVGFTACGYLALILYHALAQRYVRRDLPPQRTAFVGFVSYAISNALGFPLLLGSGLRYRLYNAWGFSSNGDAPASNPVANSIASRSPLNCGEFTHKQVRHGSQHKRRAGCAGLACRASGK